MRPPRPADDAGFLEAAARIIFMGGLNRQVVDNKWPAIREAFLGFDVPRVAAFGEADIARLAADDRVIKYQAKLQAVVDNALEMDHIAAQQGSFGSWLDDLVATAGPAAAAAELSRRFRYISAEGGRNWLYSTGYDVGPVSDKVVQKYAPFAG
jgi:DNA-3-methyladenine glycosylase I